jgi:hypothetical protein
VRCTPTVRMDPWDDRIRQPRLLFVAVFTVKGKVSLKSMIDIVSAKGEKLCRIQRVWKTARWWEILVYTGGPCYQGQESSCTGLDDVPLYRKALVNFSACAATRVASWRVLPLTREFPSQRQLQLLARHRPRHIQRLRDALPCAQGAGPVRDRRGYARHTRGLPCAHLVRPCNGI